jgi:hypothetical protein
MGTAVDCAPRGGEPLSLFRLLPPVAGCHLLPCIEGNKWQLFDFGIRSGETFS